MAAKERQEQDPRPQDGEFEDILAQCIEAHAEGGWDGVRTLCDQHPEREDQLRQHLQALARAGVLGMAGESNRPESFGPYVVMERIGQGGMSIVYHARDERLGREVALKVNAQPLLENSRSAERFAREVRAVMDLHHPCIVPIHDVGEADGRSYFTMEFVRGITLGQLLELLQHCGRTPAQLTVEDALAAVPGEPGGNWGRSYVETVCRLVLDVADALTHAHQHGVLHRDVKPSNVMVRGDGRAQLFDFGLAQLADQPALTRSGEFTGTPFYVSPEQLAGDRSTLDGRVDVYALGVTLYELLTLQRPFDGENTAQVFRKILAHDPVPPSRLNSAVSSGLEAICMTALEKDVKRRYSSTREMADDLRRFLSYEPVQARSAGRLLRFRRWARRRPVLATSAAGAVALVIVLPLVLVGINRRILAERDEVQRQLSLRTEVVDFLVGLFQLSGDAGKEAREGASELLRRGRDELATNIGSQPRVRAALMVANARAHAQLGLYEEAGALLDRAFAIQQRELGEGDPETAATLATLAEVRLALGRAELALDISSRAVETLDRLGRSADEAALRCRVTLARAAARVGRFEQGRGALLVVLDLLDQQGEHVQLEAEVREVLGDIASQAGENTEAHAQLLGALNLHRRRWSPDLDAMARVLVRLASLDELVGDEATALARSTRAVALSRATFATRTPLPYPLQIRPLKSGIYRERFQAGITAHLAGRHEQAVDAFLDCVALLPSDPVAPYNIACAESLAGHPRAATEWLDRARKAGYAGSPRRARVLASEPELAAVRAIPEGQALLQSLQRQSELCHAYREQCLILPAEGVSDEPRGLLLVLHAEGRIPQDVERSPWSDIATRQGLTLVVPSGPFGLAALPEQGMGWIDSEPAFLEDPRATSEELLRRIRTLLQGLEPDRRRVLVAGEGIGATVALDLALLAPGFFTGALLVDGAPHRVCASEYSRAASALGLKVEVVLGHDNPLPLTAGHVQPSLADLLATWLRTACRLDSEVTVCAPERKMQVVQERLERLLDR